MRVPMFTDEQFAAIQAQSEGIDKCIAGVHACIKRTEPCVSGQSGVCPYEDSIIDCTDRLNADIAKFLESASSYTAALLYALKEAEELLGFATNYQAQLEEALKLCRQELFATRIDRDRLKEKLEKEAVHA